ncbi:MAG: hypothetical protein E7096_09615 [Bacteroides sp.]|nr:hypothetical protein [Bacteroides sp.]
MNEYMDSRELMEMREQLAILTQKLEKETIVNERLMRSAMKAKASWIRRKAIIESAITLIMLPYFIWVMPGLCGISVEFCIFTCFFMVLALGYNYYIHSHFQPNKFTHGNLLEARKDTLMLKKFYANWLKFIGIPFIVVFFTWFIHDITQVIHGEELQDVLGGMAIGIVLGSIIGIYRYKKTQRTADEILEQIEDMQV